LSCSHLRYWLKYIYYHYPFKCVGINVKIQFLEHT
jgi:hypothetical protein